MSGVSEDTDAELTPTLRPDVLLAVGLDGAGTLTDPSLGRRIRLDERGVALCHALAAKNGANVSIGDVSAATGSPPEAVRGFARRLVSLDLCATARAAMRVAERGALAAVKATPAAHLRVLPNARFGCTMCGSCCGGHNVGPVSEVVLDGLTGAIEALEREVRAARRIDKDLFVTLPGGPAIPEGERATPGAHVMCHASNGSCVFLDDGGKCRIHARLGGDKKPLPCRIFPWELVATPTGVRVSVQRECRDFLRATGADAPPLEAALDEVTALVEAIDVLPSARPLPTLHGRELASWAEWEALEAQLMQAAAATDGTDPGATFLALAACIAPPTPVGHERFVVWRARLAAPLNQMLRAAPAPNAHLLIRVDALRLLLAALEAAEGWVLARALSPLRADAATLFKEHLRHALWATTPLRASSVEAGIGRLIAEWVLARLVAINRAREVKRFHVTEQDLLDGLVTVSFLFRHDDLQPVLAELDVLTNAVFVAGLEALLRDSADDAAPDRRVELVKF